MAQPPDEYSNQMTIDSNIIRDKDIATLEERVRQQQYKSETLMDYPKQFGKKRQSPSKLLSVAIESESDIDEKMYDYKEKLSQKMNVNSSSQINTNSIDSRRGIPLPNANPYSLKTNSQSTQKAKSFKAIVKESYGNSNNSQPTSMFDRNSISARGSLKEAALIRSQRTRTPNDV